MAYDSLELSPEFTYETYQEQAPAVSNTPLSSGAAVTSLNGLGGPTITLSGGTTGLSFSVAAPNITLTGTLAVANGGTGATTAAGARTALGAGIENSASQSTLGADFTLSAASGVYQDTGLSVTLPAAGTYVVTADVRAGGTFTGSPGLFIAAKLHNSTDAADVANSETMVSYTEVASVPVQHTVTVSMVITVAASKTIKLYAARNYSGTPSNTFVYSAASGRTRLSYVRVS